MIIKEWKPSVDGWSGVLKYKALDPIQTIKATRMFLAHNGPENKNRMDANLAFIEELIPFLTPLLQEVDLKSPDGEKVGLSDLCENGEYIKIWSELASYIVVGSFKKKSVTKSTSKR